MNVLLTSIGRRVSLAREFRAALTAYAPGGRLLGADASFASAGLHDAEAGFLVPPCTDPGYVPRLLEIVRREDVQVVVPLIDTELVVLAEHRAEFLRERCELLVGDLDQVRVTRHKGTTAEHFRRLGLEAPQVFHHDALARPEALPYPLFIKPAFGSGSAGALRIDGPEDLRYWLPRTEHPVVQSFEAGEEFTIDVFCDLGGVVRCAVPRQRLEVRAGETSKGLTVKDPLLMNGARRLVTALGGCRGPVTLQCFRYRGRVVFFEANLRFGGGYPLAYAAGANYPEWILRMVAGEKIPSFDGWEDRLLMLRFDDAVFVRGWGE